jgi:ATP-dependent DNA ligase
MFFLFDLLHIDSEAIGGRPLTERKERLRVLLSGAGSPLVFSDHQIGRGRAFYDHACALKVEGIVSKRVDAPYAPERRPVAQGQMLEPRGVHRDRLDRSRRHPARARRAVARLSRSGWPAGVCRSGRTGIDNKELEWLWRRLQPLAIPGMPRDVPPPRTSRFGSPLVLSRVHWVRPELVAEVKYLTWTDDNLLRQVVYQGLSEDKRAAEIHRSPPHP